MTLCWRIRHKLRSFHLNLLYRHAHESDLRSHAIMVIHSSVRSRSLWTNPSIDMPKGTYAFMSKDEMWDQNLFEKLFRYYARNIKRKPIKLWAIAILGHLSSETWTHGNIWLIRTHWLDRTHQLIATSLPCVILWLVHWPHLDAMTSGPLPSYHYFWLCVMDLALCSYGHMSLL